MFFVAESTESKEHFVCYSYCYSPPILPIGSTYTFIFRDKDNKATTTPVHFKIESYDWIDGLLTAILKSFSDKDGEYINLSNYLLDNIKLDPRWECKEEGSFGGTEQDPNPF